MKFIALNAAFPRKLIRSDTPVNLLVPVDKADTFQRNLETGSWDTWQPYTAQKGERPEAIAKRFDVSLARLEEHNQLHTEARQTGTRADHSRSGQGPRHGRSRSDMPVARRRKPDPA